MTVILAGDGNIGARTPGLITIRSAALHVLSAGNRCDLVERKLRPNEAGTRPVEAARRR